MSELKKSTVDSCYIFQSKGGSTYKFRLVTSSMKFIVNNNWDTGLKLTLQCAYCKNSILIASYRWSDISEIYICTLYAVKPDQKLYVCNCIWCLISCLIDAELYLSEKSWNIQRRAPSIGRYAFKSNQQKRLSYLTK